VYPVGVFAPAGAAFLPALRRAPTWISPGIHVRIEFLGHGVIPVKIYVGNLPFSATESEVQDLFSQYGDVQSVALINDRETGRPRGFGFVEMPDDAAKEAISNLNGQQMGDRPLTVNEARPRDNRDSRGGGGGGWRH